MLRGVWHILCKILYPTIFYCIYYERAVAIPFYCQKDKMYICICTAESKRCRNNFHSNQSNAAWKQKRGMDAHKHNIVYEYFFFFEIFILPRLACVGMSAGVRPRNMNFINEQRQERIYVNSFVNGSNSMCACVCVCARAHRPIKKHTQTLSLSIINTTHAHWCSRTTANKSFEEEQQALGGDTGNMRSSLRLGWIFPSAT